jgi:DNA-binding XRE family transcriptional regulator
MRVASPLHSGHNHGVNTDHLLLLSAARRHAKRGTGYAVRVAAGLTLTEVARAVGADQSTIWRWENDKTQPHGERAARWAALLGELEAAGHAPVRGEPSGKVA